MSGPRIVNPRFVEATIGARAGQVIEPDARERDVQRLFGSDEFERVGDRFLEEHGKRILAVEAIEKSRGPDYLRFGLGLSSDCRGGAHYTLCGRYRRTWLNAHSVACRSVAPTAYIPSGISR